MEEDPIFKINNLYPSKLKRITHYNHTKKQRNVLLAQALTQTITFTKVKARFVCFITLPTTYQLKFNEKI